MTLCIAVVALGLFVLGHNRRLAVNRRFAVMALTTGGWILAISLALAAKDPRSTVTLGRVGFAFASGIPLSLVWMVGSLSDFRNRHATRRVAILCAVCFCFVLASFSNLIVAGATPSLPRANFVYGPVHRFFGLYFLTSFAFGLYTLSKTIAGASGLRRLQLRYLLLGISLTGLGAMTTNLVVPLLWHTSRYSALGPYFSLFFFSFSAHAIIRYRLMDIRVIIRQSVVYLFAIAISASLFLAAAEFLRRLAGYDQDRVPLIQALVVSIALAIFFQPLKNSVQTWLNRYLYRHSYDYQRTMRDASRHLSAILDLDPLLDYLTSVIEVTFKSETVTVYLRDNSETSFSARASQTSTLPSTPPGPQTVPNASSLLTLFRLNQEAFVREEARLHPNDRQRVTAAEELKLLGGEIAFPLSDHSTITGIIVVGQKRSGDPYFREDIDLLETLVGQAAVAMKNAQLYQQVVLVNEYVDNILSTMQSGVIAVNASGEVSLFNRAAERLTGLDRSSIRAQSYKLLPTPLVSPLQSALDAQSSRSEFEVTIELEETTRVPLVCSTAILKDRAGYTAGALIVFSDLTRLKDLERENRRAERLASFGALASGVAHEIKNPLVAIRTFAELLPERYQDTDFREDFSKVVIREIARIDDLVGRLRGIAATAPKQVGTVDIREPIKETLLLLRAQFEQTHTTVSYEFNDPAPFVAVDESQLKQLFLNLLLNAIEAMGPGGDLAIQLSRREAHGEQWISVEVSDSGPGIPESVKTNIFNPFFTTKPRGSGLGLAICRGITDAHRGTIRAEVRADRQGTMMVVEFPATSQTALLTEDSVLPA